MLKSIFKTKLDSTAALFQILALSLLLSMGLVLRVMADDNPSQQATKVAKQASEQATKVARIVADQTQRDIKDHANYLKEIQAKHDDMAGEVFFDCHLQWVKHQDPFGVAGLNGDVALQFHVTVNKANQWTPIDQTMVLTFFSDSANHQTNYSGTITVDGRPITFANGMHYHTDKPWGISQKGQVLEVIDFPISYDGFAAIANGKIVIGKMGGVDFEVKDFQQGVFREMYFETKAKPKVPAAPASKD